MKKSSYAWLEIRTLKMENRRLESAPFGAGRFKVSDDGTAAANYYITDHLGSTRVVFDTAKNVLDRINYYPFGGTWSGTETRYNFSGKESQEKFGYNVLDFGARKYNPTLVRWTGPDPLSEKYRDISPYAYCANNPIRYIDPDGRKIVDKNGNTLYQNGAWTEHAQNSPDVVRIGNLMMQTKKGTEMFNKMVENDATITISLNQTDMEKSVNGYPALGKIRRQIDEIDGKIKLLNAHITLYMVNIFMSSLVDGIPVDHQIAATAGHEAEHTSDENVQQSYENEREGKDHNTEKKPNEVEQEILDEYRSQR